MLVFSRLDAALTPDEIYLRGLLDARRPTESEITMQFKKFHQGGCLLQLFTTDMALLALVLRYATSNNTETLLDLTPTMTTTLESLAATFELGTLVGLQQEGYLDVQQTKTLTTEQIQAWCQSVVVDGDEGAERVRYTVAPIVGEGESDADT